MDNLLAFQILPYHVVKLIVDHVAGSSRLQFDGVTTNSDEYRILQVPLLWVCHNFRAFLSYPAHLLAKELWVKLDISLTSVDKGYYDLEPVCDNDQEPVHSNGLALDGNNDWDLEGDNDWALEGNDDWDAGSDNAYTPRSRYIYPLDTAANITAFAQ
ncbi:hypothetical protein GGI17_006740 [Coemansia sp. S146]|nr:hypothetical protein GGI17_006740 [Coemansia sp. S146]